MRRRTRRKQKEEKNEGDEGGDGVPLTQMYVTGDVDESDDRPLTQVESTTNMSDDNDIGDDIRASETKKPRLTPLMRLNPDPSKIASGQLKLPEEAASAQSSSTTVATAGRTDLVRPVRKSKKLARAKNKK